MLYVIVAISFLVIVHETGHYLAARAFGMRVLRYSIGLGPVLFKYQPKGSPTVFQIAAIPFLAYVQIDGMNPHDEVRPDDPAIFQNKSVFARIVTIFAGSFFNYAAASLIWFGAYAVQGRPVDPFAVVDQVLPNSAAAEAGLAAGDRIVAADGQQIETFADLLRVTLASEGRPVAYTVERGTQQLTLNIAPRLDEGRYRIGVRPAARFEHVAVGPAALLALEAPFAFTKMNIEGLFAALRNGDTSGVGGVVRMGQEVHESAQRGLRDYIETIAMLSVALGMFNLFPFPALDGGRLVFLFFELVTRRKPNEKVETMVHTVGILVLLALIVMVTFRDVVRLTS